MLRKSYINHRMQSGIIILDRFIRIVFTVLILLILMHIYANSTVDSIKFPSKKFEGNFKDVSLKNLLSIIVSEIPYNFVIDVNPETKISISFKRSTIKEAFKSIVTYGNLEVIKIDDRTFLIIDKEKAKQYIKRDQFVVRLIYCPADYVKNILYTSYKDVNFLVDNFSNSLIIECSSDKADYITKLVKLFDTPESELKTKVFKLSNAKAKEIQGILSNSVYDFQNPVIKHQVKIDADERTNSIVVTAPKYVLNNIQQILYDIVDKKLPQVLIDIQVVEINRDRMKDLGIYPGENSNITVLLERSPTQQQQQPINPLDAVVFVQSDKIAFPVRTGINLRVLMLEKKGVARILANPKLLASDGKVAKVFLGDRIPYLAPQLVPIGQTTSIQQNILFTDVGINLEFQPMVTKDKHINLKINPKLSYLVKLDPAPWTATREVLTELTVKSEDTIVIAGLIREEERKTYFKIPLIGDIPIIGSLFRAEKKSIQNSEVVFIITPKIINLANDTISNPNENPKNENPKNENVNQESSEKQSP
ncbi:MAG: secretin N-terminal domain-containing protein [bacterium]